jgi:hypothetical protein
MLSLYREVLLSLTVNVIHLSRMQRRLKPARSLKAAAQWGRALAA